MKISTSKLIGPALDWAVAKCKGYRYYKKDQTEDADGLVIRIKGEDHLYTPSTNWEQGGPIIEREELGIRRNAPCSKGREWEACPSITARGAGGKWGYGPTPLIAAMRCYVASKLGEEVEVPDALLS